MKIITLNANGIRAATRKGMFPWLIEQDADVICLQELKAQAEQIEDDAFHIPGYTRYLHCAEKKGYSGVAIYSKLPVDEVTYGLGWSPIDEEGRYVQIDVGNLTVASLYLPSGTSGDERQAIKYACLDKFESHLAEWVESGRDFIICGDMNIAHKQIDLKNWRGNQKNSGFLPEERAWLDKVFDEIGFVDAFRVINEEPEQYTWWSNRGQAWAKNVGWRIDYQWVTAALRERIKTVSIYKDERFSDHAPLIIDYEYDIR